MSVTLSDQQYDAIMSALVTVARGKKVNQCGNERPIYRTELLTEAREACDAVGINWLALNIPWNRSLTPRS